MCPSIRYMMKLRSFPWHALLFAIYPILSLYTYNRNEVPFSDVLRSLLVALGVAGGLFMLFWLLLRDAPRAGLVCSLCSLLFFTFGHIQTILTRAIQQAVAINVLMAVWSAILILGVWVIARKVRRSPTRLTQVLNITAAAALVLGGYPLVIDAIRDLTHTTALRGSAAQDVPGMESPSPASEGIARAEQRDIYYIILDGFGSEDSLREIYDIENLDLYGYLKEAGFQVAKQSHSNYMITMQSIPSSLNFHYLDELIEIDPQAFNYGPFETLVDDNQASVFLRKMGYRTMMISSGFVATKMENADVLIEAGGGETINAFETSLLFNTAMLPWMNIITPQAHRQKTLEVFRQVVVQANAPGPKFVFVHILIPHPPFLFDAQGNPVLNSTVSGRQGMQAGPADVAADSGPTNWRVAYRRGYQEQVVFTSRKTREMITQLLESYRDRSLPDPVIIVQGDHGPDTYTDWNNIETSCLRERYSILNALYLPGAPEGTVPQDLTPVNTFRIVFNQYFNANLPLAENRMYAFQLPFLYKFTEVTGKVDQCNNPAVK